MVRSRALTLPAMSKLRPPSVQTVHNSPELDITSSSSEKIRSKAEFHEIQKSQLLLFGDLMVGAYYAPDPPEKHTFILRGSILCGLTNLSNGAHLIEIGHRLRQNQRSLPDEEDQDEWQPRNHKHVKDWNED